MYNFTWTIGSDWKTRMLDWPPSTRRVPQPSAGIANEYLDLLLPNDTYLSREKRNDWMPQLNILVFIFKTWKNIHERERRKSREKKNRSWKIKKGKDRKGIIFLFWLCYRDRWYLGFLKEGETFRRKTHKRVNYIFNRLEKKGKVDIFLAFCPASIKGKIMNKIKSVTLKTKNRHFSFLLLFRVFIYFPPQSEGLALDRARPLPFKPKKLSVTSWHEKHFKKGYIVIT